MLEKVIHTIATGNFSQEQALKFAAQRSVSLTAEEAKALQSVVGSPAWQQLKSTSHLDALLALWPEAYKPVD